MKKTKKEIYLKIHQSGKERIVAACDRELLGKKYFEKELKLEVKKEFYQGTLANLEDLNKEMKKATIVNLTGNKVVKFALQHNFLSQENILKISGIRHAQIVFL